MLLKKDGKDVAGLPRYCLTKASARVQAGRLLRLVRSCRGGFVIRAFESHIFRLLAKLGPQAGVLRTVRVEVYRFHAGEGAP